MLRQCLLFLSLSAVGLVGCNQHSASPIQPQEPVIAAGEIGSRLPDFSVKDLQGHPLSSAGLRGKVVLVDFWVTWCQTCKKEMPGYQKLLDRYGSRGLVVIGFKFDTMRHMEDPLQFATKIGVRYPLAVGTEDVKQRFILAYTDGVIEVTNQGGEEWGVQGLLNAVTRGTLCSGGVGDLVDLIFNSMDDFSEEHQTDDATLAVVRVI